MVEDTNTSVDTKRFITKDEKHMLLDALKRVGYNNQRSTVDALLEEGWRKWDHASPSYHYSAFNQIMNGKEPIDENTVKRILKLCNNDPRIQFILLTAGVPHEGTPVYHNPLEWESPLRDYFDCIRSIYTSREPKGKLRILGDLEKLVQGLKE